MIDYPGLSCFDGPYCVASVVFKGWACVPCFEGMGVPSLSNDAFGMCQDFDSWWGNWGGIEVIASMELFQADSLGLILDPLSKLSVSSACGMVLSHSWSGNALSIDHHPAIKWFLAVRIALSAVLVLWSLGGANWYLTSLRSKYSLTLVGHSLSSLWNFGLHPPRVRV